MTISPKEKYKNVNVLTVTIAPGGMGYVRPTVHDAPMLAVSRQLGKVVYAHPTVRDAPMKAVIIQ